MIGLRSEPRLAGWHQRHTPNCYAILHGKHVLQIVVWMTRRKEGSGKRGIPECGSPLYLGQPTKVSSLPFLIFEWRWWALSCLSQTCSELRWHGAGGGDSRLYSSMCTRGFMTVRGHRGSSQWWEYTIPGLNLVASFLPPGQFSSSCV